MQRRWSSWAELNTVAHRYFGMHCHPESISVAFVIGPRRRPCATSSTSWRWRTSSRVMWPNSFWVTWSTLLVKWRTSSIVACRSSVSLSVELFVEQSMMMSSDKRRRRSSSSIAHHISNTFASLVTVFYVWLCYTVAVRLQRRRVVGQRQPADPARLWWRQPSQRNQLIGEDSNYSANEHHRRQNGQQNIYDAQMKPQTSVVGAQAAHCNLDAVLLLLLLLVHRCRHLISCNLPNARNTCSSFVFSQSEKKLSISAIWDRTTDRFVATQTTTAFVSKASHDSSSWVRE